MSRSYVYEIKHGTATAECIPVDIYMQQRNISEKDVQAKPIKIFEPFVTQGYYDGMEIEI